MCIAALRYRRFIFRSNLVELKYRNGDLLLPMPSDNDRQLSSSLLLVRFESPTDLLPRRAFHFWRFFLKIWLDPGGCRYCAARKAVELSVERRPWMKVQAGARFFQRTRASSSSTRAY